MGICIPWRYRLRNTGSESQETFANASLQPRQGSCCPEEWNSLLFFHSVSPWDPFGCVNLSPGCLGLISAWEKPGQHPPPAGLFGRANSAIQQDKTPTFQTLFRPAGCLRALGAAVSSDARAEPNRAPGSHPTPVLGRDALGVRLPARGRLGGSVQPRACVFSQLHWLEWVQKAILPWLGAFMSLRGVRRVVQAF